MKKTLLFGLLVLWALGYASIAQAQENIDTVCNNKCQEVGCDETMPDGTCWGDAVQECLTSCKANYDKCVEWGDTVETCVCIADWGIKLNTRFPLIGRCIAKSTDGTVGAITEVFTKIFMTLILTLGFGMLIWSGVQFAMNKPAEGRKTIMNVIIAFAALGSLGIILRLINPNFFR